MKSINNKKIAGRISALKSAIANYSQQAHIMGNPTSDEAKRALDSSKNAVDEIRQLIIEDPVFARDIPMIDLANYYSVLLGHAQSSSSIAEEVVGYLGEDEKIFNQDFDDGMTYRRMLKELSDSRM